MSLPSRALILAVQNLVHTKADGDPQDLTWRAIYKALTGTDWKEPTAATLPTGSVEGFPAEALHLILDAEGVDQPSKWPGGNSGITLGYGCDIGADPASLEFWRGILPDDQIATLAQAKGKTGLDAKQIATRFVGIKVTQEQALEVFIKKSLPVEIAKTKQTYPGIDIFPKSVLGAMTSITYNRGTDLDWNERDGNRREELRAIYGIIKREAETPEVERDIPAACQRIAAQIRNMKRLWVGKGLDGLLARRDAEAALVTA